jgi:hypothetical protein
MAIYGYKSPDGKTHCNVAEGFVSLGMNGVNGKCYFFIDTNVTIPDQPAEIGWSVITDEEELDSVAKYCPAFFRDREATKAEVGLA